MKKVFHLAHGLFFTLGSAMVIYMVSDAVIYMPRRDVLLPTLFACLAYGLFLGLAALLTRQLETASLIATFFVLGFLYTWSLFMVILVGALLCIGILTLRMKRFRLKTIHLALNALAVAVVGYYGVRFLSLSVAYPAAEQEVALEDVWNPQVPFTGSSRPDVYYIILDGYGRADMLEQILAFDNSEFIEALDQRGFVVGTRSRPNYPTTILSLTSSLNMQYLDPLSEQMGDGKVWWPLIDLIHHNQVRTDLESLGYQTVFFASSYDYTNIRDGDDYESPYPVVLNNFSTYFLSYTNLDILGPLARQAGVAWPSYGTHRTVILHTLRTLPQVAAMPGPKFVFAHILNAHPPYVFDAQGNPVDPDTPYSLMVLDEDAHRDAYVAQVSYLNREILAAVDGILAASATPPVIILQADHGSGIYLHVSSIEQTCLSERYSIFNAYYLPNVSAADVPTDITPVNSFRLVFNEYFNAGLELLPERNYFSSNFDFFRFTEVTDQIGSYCPLPAGAP